MNKKFYRICAVRKNNTDDIMEFLCFETTNNFTINPIVFGIIKKEGVINMINTENAIFRTFYYSSDTSQLINGARVEVLDNKNLRTGNNDTHKDNLDSLPIF